MSSGDSVSSAVDVSKTGIGRDVASGEPSLVAFEPLTRVMTRARIRARYSRVIGGLKRSNTRFMDYGCICPDRMSSDHSRLRLATMFSRFQSQPEEGR
jgi:hypothetical protein